MASDLGPLGPLLVAGFVIVYVLIRQPFVSEMAGISINWIAILLVAIGGLLGAVNG